jgi:glycerophosphoryl diester phosphodiesterase
MDLVARLRGGEGGTCVVLGHRGARGVLPENTLAGLDYLPGIGVAAAEIDLAVTRDGVPVVVHDPLLDPDKVRGPDGAWLSDGVRVIDLTAAELALWDVGGLRPGSVAAGLFPDQRSVPGARVPTLRAVCQWAAARPGFVLTLELKSDPTAPALTPPPADMVAAVLAEVDAAGIGDRVILQAFDWRVLEAARGMGVVLSGLSHMEKTVRPGSPWLAGRACGPDDLAGALADTGAQVWCPFRDDLTPERLARARALGLLVHVWTVNDAGDIARFAAMGVDGIITDYPARAVSVLSGMGLSAVPRVTAAA